MRPRSGFKTHAVRAASLVDRTGEALAPALHVVIAVPAQDTVATDFSFDLAKLVGFTVAQAPEIRVTLLHNKGTIVESTRHMLAKQVVADDSVTHVLWLDSDMRFPKDALFRLLAADEDIVAAIYPGRRAPIIPTATIGDEQLLFIEPARSAQPDMLIEASRCGMGCMLMRADVLRKIPKPWFAVSYSSEQDIYQGEDAFFCRKAQDAGYRVMIDPNLSREVKHVGSFAFDYTHALQTLQAFKARDAAAAAPNAAALGANA